MKKVRHEIFNQKVIERIQRGEWGLEEIQYLHENKQKHHLNNEDIIVYLNALHEYAYLVFLQDGVITIEERMELNHIKHYINNIGFKNQTKLNIEHIKGRIDNVRSMYMSNHSHKQGLGFSYSNKQTAQESVNYEYKSCHRPDLRYKSPKPTPYSW